MLAVDDFPDLSDAVLNPATGELRAQISGTVLDANKLTGAVRGVWLVGNLREVLNQVVEICSDTDRIGHVDAPGMVLDGFRVESA